MQSMNKIIAGVAISLVSASLFGQPAGNGPRGGYRFDKSNTPGWSMMTPEERARHHDKMMSLQNYDECKAYMEEHRASMEARAKEKGRPMRGPRQDACERMKSRGMLK
ncbi:hypothetical protein [Noviherbaspirillum galbum]|uniref:Uncharacterized protein n=1 Tax=Noviherbaspirillum galbum TaxID=2709383 RepID=A0A6B3SNP2_9BURK|nr:hypothetical protein [Noviherbaspirillum galbum]NEX62363.1 hypothetical protein [Noviherbaspirillum galbum]